MKIISGNHDIDFDNGLWIDGDGEFDCCAMNYIDVEQFSIGLEFKDMNLEQLKDNIKVKDDGFALKDIDGVPKWGQARSEQNGYYSNMTTLKIGLDDESIVLAELSGDIE